METSTRRGLPRAMVDDVFLAPVHINAGGTVYTTTLDTLTKYTESKLAKLFDGTLAVPIDPINRQYFLDVNGSVFVHVLDFLRYGELLLPEDFTQLPLLTKLADYFEIHDMIQALINMGREESSGIQEEGGNCIGKLQKKKCKSIKYLGTIMERSESYENQNSSSLEPEKMKKDDTVEAGKINIGTCELGIVKLGMLEGGKIDFGTIESAKMKGKMLEFDILTAKDTETEKLSAGNIDSEVIETKSTKVEVLKAGHLKCDTVEMEKVKTGNVEMKTVDAALTKMEMLETRSLKSQNADLGKVNAEDFKIKRLEAESLKLKSLDLETVTSNFINAVLSKCAITNSDGIDKNGSNFAIVHVGADGVCVVASDIGLQLNDIDSKFRRKQSSCYNSCCWSATGGTIFRHPFHGNYSYETLFLKVLVKFSKDGYKLYSATSLMIKYNADDVFYKNEIDKGVTRSVREYIFVK